MSKSAAFEQEYLELVFVNTAGTIMTLLGITPGSAANLYIGLHTADVGEGGDQETNEATYSGYARKLLAQGGTNWDVFEDGADIWKVRNKLPVTFGKRTDAGAPETLTHWSVGTALVGVGNVLYKGSIITPVAGLVVAQNITPQIPIHGMKIQED